MSAGMDPTGCECEQNLKFREDTERKEKEVLGKEVGAKDHT